MGKQKIKCLNIRFALFLAVAYPVTIPAASQGKTSGSSKNQEVMNYSLMPDVLPGTEKLTMEGDLSEQMMDGAHGFIERKINESVIGRAKYWNRNLTGREAYESSVEPNRMRLMKCIGVEDKNEPFINYRIGLPDNRPVMHMQKISLDNDPTIIAETSKYQVFQVRWPALDRVSGEGLLLEPGNTPVANIIAIPDAGQTPEQLAGLAPGIPPESQFARQLAENGYRVLIPVLISRTLINQGSPEQMTYRERIYRQAYHMGRHIIGYEVQKIMAAVDWFRQSDNNDLKVGVAGYCEGGLIAFYSAAVDKRIDAALVSGYFTSGLKVWDEPLYRNVWGFLSEFGDAEIASLIAPRPLIVEYSIVPEIFEKVDQVQGKPVKVNGFPFTGYKGIIKTPPFMDVKAEFDRIDALTKPGFQKKYLISGKENLPLNFGSEKAMESFCRSLGAGKPAPVSGEIPGDRRRSFSIDDRQIRQVKEIEDHVQWLVRVSDQTRNRYFLYNILPEIEKRQWSTKPYHTYYPVERFIGPAKEYRKYFHEEILGRFDDPMMPPDAHTRKIYDRERWTGYEVVMNVYPDLFAWGYLLIPKDIKPGERRPVVVCQHGRSGLPSVMVEGNSTAYNDAGAKLADQGFVVYAPYNLYRGEERYRWLSKKANTIKKSLFSFIISQHDQTLRWLGTLPFVDKNRIAFYGLSYGGETAMRVPAVLESYCLSICSGDFGDWTRKVTDTYSRSFMNSIEWEMPYFNMGSTFSYAEMAYLIFPRPFMVERGHDDMVQPDEWVAYEYGKVRYLYDQFNLGDRTTIEFFNGGHSMRCLGTFGFLHKHLNWP
jgi:dienelactone hydrolase